MEEAKKMKEARLSIYLTKDIKDRLNHICKQKGITMSAVIKMLISEYVKKEEL